MCFYFCVVVPLSNNVSVAIEASTGAANFTEKLIDQYHWTVELAHPGYVARLKQTPDMSDGTVAKLLAVDDQWGKMVAPNGID